jgi:hypothetical protein
MIGDSGLVRFLQYTCGATALIGSVGFGDSRPPKKSGAPRSALQLKYFNLSHCELGNSAVHFLSRMLSAGLLPQLETLMLAGNNISCVGVDAIVDAMRFLQPNCRISELSLGLNNIGNDGLMSITGAIVSGTFSNIKVVYNRVFLVTLADGTCILQTLDVSDCGNVLESIIKLSRAVNVSVENLKALRHLRLFGNQFPASKLKALGLSKDLLRRVKVT